MLVCLLVQWGRWRGGGGRLGGERVLASAVPAEWMCVFRAEIDWVRGWGGEGGELLGDIVVGMDAL